VEKDEIRSAKKKIPFMALGDYKVVLYGFDGFLDTPQIFVRDNILALGTEEKIVIMLLLRKSRKDSCSEPQEIYDFGLPGGLSSLGRGTDGPFLDVTSGPYQHGFPVTREPFMRYMNIKKTMISTTLDHLRGTHQPSCLILN
jgi:hypothetical protein